MFKVTESVDYLDPNPAVAFFDTRWEADEYLSERIHSRVEFEVQHSPYMVSEKNYNDLVQYESTFSYCGNCINNHFNNSKSSQECI